MADEAARLPYDSAAERAVLGAVLLDRRQLDAVRQVVAPADFYDSRHRRVFEAVCALDDAQESIDIVTLRARLDREGALEAAGGVGFLAELFDGLALSTNAAEYAGIVGGHSLARKLHRYGARIAQEVGRQEPRTLLEEAEKSLFAIAEGVETGAPVPIGEATGPIAEEAQHERKTLSGISTGLGGLDALMGGLRPSDLIILGARPGEGKTSLALNISLAAALKKRKVLVFSLEMPVRQIAIRLLFSHAQVNAREFSQAGMFSAGDRQKIRNSNDRIRALPIWVDDSTVTPMELRSKARQHRRDPGLDLIVVDYLQLMHAGQSGDRRFENRNLEIAEISRSLKLLAKELEVPILALSQLSRAPEQRDASVPRLSDLRESGALEQDADIVLFIHRERRRPARNDDSGPPADEGPPVRRVMVAKNRNGPTGVVQLAWLDRFTLFRSIEDPSALGAGEPEGAAANGFEERPPPIEFPSGAEIPPEPADDPTDDPADDPGF